VAVVIDFDALGHVTELERIGQLAQDLALRRGLRETAVERFLGVALGLLHELSAGAALRNFNRDLAIGALRQRFLEQLTVDDRPVDEDPPRWRQILVELDEKTR